jgi:2-polyprenyl-3-methyl-5-hydroxy-6-metoxy-1,4-benzoquinol methylase
MSMAASSRAIAQACPVCSGHLEPHTLEVRDPISGEQFIIVQCSGCGLGVTSPAPGRIEDYYRERYYGNRHAFTARLCAWRRRRLVARHARPGDRSWLLDVGSGEGAFLETASRAGWNAAGVEIHDLPGVGKYPVYRTLEEAAASAPYRCITLWHVLEHVPAPLECLSHLRSILSTDGVLVLAVPDFGGLQARIFGRHWLHLDVPRHLHHFTALSVVRLLRAAGFDVLHTAHQELEYDWFGWIQSALNAVMATPNVLFDALTGKPPRVGRLAVGASYAAASLLALPALALTAASTLARCGGTFLVVARPQTR